MTDESTFWMHLPLTTREKLRAKQNLKEYRACVRELTAVPMESQVAAENDYLENENRLLYKRMSQNDTVLINIPPDNYRVLYRLAKELRENDRSRITALKFDDLRHAAGEYARNPPQQKQNQIPLAMEQKIVDIALENILWGSPHIQFAMRNIGYLETKPHQVIGVLKRNNIPIAKYRRAKGIPWDCLLPCLEKLLAEEDDDEPHPRVKISGMPRNPYRRPHKRLIRFLRNATISPEELALNRYLRLENMLLVGHYYRNRRELHLTGDEKRTLAAPASKLRGLNRRHVPLLTPAQIIQYTRKQAAKKYASACPRTKREEEYISTRYLEDLLRGLLEDHHFSSREKVYALMKEYFGEGLPAFRVYDVLGKLGFFVEKLRKGIPWREFKRKFADVTWAGDFFSVDVMSKYGILTYQVMFFVHLGTGEVTIAGASHHATSEWVISLIRQWTDAGSPFGANARFLIRDCDRRYTKDVDWYFTSIGLLPRRITPGAPVMNCQAEIFVNQIKSECLNQLPIFSEKELKMLLRFYQQYYNTQRPNARARGGCIHEDASHWQRDGEVVLESLLPGILNFYCRHSFDKSA